ncbi:MAG TPA: threonine synthase [Jiangellaceae bacterium]|nr:threonine synthase [Jiangellaceae bacterium]
MAHLWRGVIEEYREWMPVTSTTVVVTLQEGGTPLVPSAWLSELTSCDVLLKVEGSNPTGSFKDRGMTVAISKALEGDAKAVVCASTGNTGASAAAYAVRAGMTPIVLVPEGRVAGPKLAQAVVHGGRIVAVDGSFDDCLRLARGLADEYPVALVNSLNPHRLAGQKSAAFEVVDAVGDAPDVHVLPVGNAGNISAYWLGYQQYAAGGRGSRRPRMWGFQAAGAAPIVRGEPVPDPQTVASAIRIGDPASWQLAIAARDESGGFIDAVTDEQILSAQRDLSSRDGLFVEPASAAGVAGLVASVADGRLDPGQVVVVTVTGHGLKDVETASAAYGDVRPEVVPADVHAAASALGLG